MLLNKIQYKFCLVTTISFIFCINIGTAIAAASESQHFIPKIPYLNIDGNIRTYFFIRTFGNPNIPTQRAFSLGGKLNSLTDNFYDFKLGATVYTAQPLGLNSDNPLKVDFSLPGKPVTALGQAFIQYENKLALIRVGNQLINTPWMNPADSRMTPATYQGFYARLTPLPDLNLSAMRIIRFKTRISNTFTRTNLYSPINLATPLPVVGTQAVIGALAFGAEYINGNLKAQAWDYQFYDFANLFYLDASYKIKVNSWFTPHVAAQAGYERNLGNIAFSQPNFVRVNPGLFGILLGAEIADGSITVGYNYIPTRSKAFKNGDIISPYTSGFPGDPLYTTSMIAGLIEKAAGHAAKITAQYKFCKKQITVLISYARYNTLPFTTNTSESDFDVTYTPLVGLKNLSLRYRIGILLHNPAFGRFIYNRLMLQYDFK